MTSFYIYFRFFNFDFSIFKFEFIFFSLFQGFSHAFLIFRESFSYIMNIVYRRVHLSCILNKLGHFLSLKGKLSSDPETKPSNVRIDFVKSFLKSHSFQETRASSTVSCETNRADKIILNIFGAAM